MKKIYFVCFFMIAFLSHSFGQTNKELIQNGDIAMQKGQYSYAVHYYSLVIFKIQKAEEAVYYPYDVTNNYKLPEQTEQGAVKPPENPTEKEIQIIHKLSEAYRLSNDYINAEVWFEAAIKNPRSEFPYSRYFYGLTLMHNYKYDEAIEQFELFKKENNEPENRYYKLADSKIINCEFAKNPDNTTDLLYITNMDSTLNLGSSNFAMRFAPDNYILFASALPDSSEIYKEDKLKKYLLDIYMVKRNDDGSLGKVEKLPASINSNDFHEGSATLSPEGNILYYTSIDPNDRNETKVYMVKKLNNQWLKPQMMGPDVNVKGFRSMDPYITEDGQHLYYSSNRPGGEGGMDLWMVDIDEDGNTSNMQNLGKYINTLDDEISPFVHQKTKTLYFSSNGHIGFGGFDIYQSQWNNSTDWYGTVINIGAPANSSRDDAYYIIDEKQEIGYLSSDREICDECDTVYNLKKFCYQLYEIKKPEIKFAVKGYVYDENTNEPLANASIEFKDITYQWDHFSIETDENGYYYKELIPNVEVFMKATLKDYFADQGLVSNVGETESIVYEQDFYLRKIPSGEIAIEGIEYDFDSANLRPESKLILDEVVKFLELNSNISIEIRSHTDQRGNDDYNLKLSDRRAKSVVDYLISQGISPSRLKSKGYGESEPAEVPNENGEIVALTEEYIKSLPNKDLQEQAHQKNRRTAFKVLEQ